MDIAALQAEVVALRGQVNDAVAGDDLVLVERLRACANGMGTFKTNRGDFGLCDDAADRLSGLIAENEALKEANENLGILSSEDVAMYQQAISRAEKAETEAADAIAALQAEVARLVAVSKRYSEENDRYDEDNAEAMKAWRASRLALLDAIAEIGGKNASQG